MHTFDFLIALLWIVWLIYWQLSAMKAKQSIRRHNWLIDGGIRILIIVIILIFLHVPVLYHFVLNINSKSFYENPYVGSIGIIIALVGFALSIWARVSLGTNWGMPRTLREKPELVTSGPYAFIRHPIYTGMIIAMLGTTIVTNILWIIAFIILAAYFIYSAKREEKDMLEQFSKEYKEYKKRTKFLIPFIY